jgi:hypothetical protein
VWRWDYFVGTLSHLREHAATAESFESAETSLEPALEMKRKQFDPSDPAYRLSDDARAAAEQAFKAWAIDRGYEPVVSNLSARQHLA